MSSTALQTVESSGAPLVQTSVRAVGLLRPIANPADVLAAQNETRALVKAALVKDRDFGTIPGTDKPTLLKPGAERLALGFGLAPRFRILEQEVDHDREVKYVKRKKIWRNEYPNDKRFDWQEEAGASIGLYRFVVECEMVHRDSGVVIASCLGACSSMESKYVDRPRDVENTILKMAEKRALVGATILALGLSDEFAQDVEDLAANGAIGERAESAASPASSEPEAKCPKCRGKMWDNRAKKANAKAPDFKCRDKACDGVYWPGQWPPKADEEGSAAASSDVVAQSESTPAALTADTVLGFGPYRDLTAREAPIDFLRWAIQDGRKLGDRTAEWQEVFRLELERRTMESEPEPPKRPAPVEGDDLPF